MEPVHFPCSDQLLQGESETGAGFGTLNHRLDRYAAGHHRSLQMSHYLKSQNEVNLSSVLARCGSYLVFHHYFTVDELRLISADFCRKSLLCPFCAMRRGSKYLKAYLERVRLIQSGKSDLSCYLVTLTVKNGSHLMERFSQLTQSLKKMIHARHDYLGNPQKRRHVEFSKAIGGVYSIEIKRGSGSDLWHPHCHMVWLCHEKPDAQKLSEEWMGWTKDSYIIDVTPFYDQQDSVKGFLEVFKYALKFTDLDLADNFEAFQKLSGRRLVNSFGCLRGIDVPDGLGDETLDDLPYLRIFYEWMQAARGYSVVPDQTYVVKSNDEKE